METLGIPETARLLGLPPHAVREMIEEGQLEARRVDSRWRVTRFAIERARVLLQPGPRPLSDVDRPGVDVTHGDVEARLAALEERLDRLEATAERHPARLPQ